MARDLNTCLLAARQNLDQQIAAVMNCDLLGGEMPLTMETANNPILYELPQGTAVNRPIDAVPIEPGQIPAQPAPVDAPIKQEIMQRNNTTQAGDPLQWIKQNPLVVGLGVVGLLLLLKSKKRS